MKSGKTQKDDMKYPDCFRTHEDCMKCPNFGQECIEKINELDYYYYVIDNCVIGA